MFRDNWSYVQSPQTCLEAGFHLLFKANGFVIYKAAIHRKVSNSPEPPDRPALPPGPAASAQLQAGHSTLKAGDRLSTKAPQVRSQLSRAPQQELGLLGGSSSVENDPPGATRVPTGNTTFKPLCIHVNSWQREESLRSRGKMCT